MFGYIYVNEQELKLRELNTYRSFYCGLCQDLHKRYGRTAQLMLNYDMTFLALLLTGLYEPETLTEEHRCLLHPTKKHQMVGNEAVDYAADMCVLLSYQKLEDDWKDERKLLRRAGASLLRSDYARIREAWPRQAKAVEENIALLAQAEGEGRKEIDYVSGLSGHFLGEVFVWKEDEWQEELRAMGFYMGKFIYLMDALEDVEQDRKKGNFNLFSDYGQVWGEEQEPKMRGMLTEMMAMASRAFERLPILENAEIIRNILYSGVWSRYVLLRDTQRKRQEKKMKG